MNRTRSFRRHQANRAKCRAKRFLKTIGYTPTKKQVNLYATDRKPCSCGICKNERYKETRQHTKKIKDYEL